MKQLVRQQVSQGKQSVKLLLLQQIFLPFIMWGKKQAILWHDLMKWFTVPALVSLVSFSTPRHTGPLYGASEQGSIYPQNTYCALPWLCWHHCQSQNCGWAYPALQAAFPSCVHGKPQLTHGRGPIHHFYIQKCLQKACLRGPKALWRKNMNGLHFCFL